MKVSTQRESSMVMTMAELPIRRGSCRDLGCFIAAVAVADRPRCAAVGCLVRTRSKREWARELCGGRVLKERLVDAMAMERAEEEEVGGWTGAPAGRGVVGGSLA
jgi:hypothetical protein